MAQQLSRLPAVEVAGISCYPGHCRPEDPALPEKLHDVDSFLRETRDAFATAGFRTDRISGCSTPTRYLTHTTCVNELRSGTYVFLERNDGQVDECALWVEVTVISDAVPGQIIVDAGSKTFTEDGHPDGGHGAVKGWPAIDFAQINEEHGYLDVSSLDERPAVGQHLQIIPNHACGCVNLHDGLLAVHSLSKRSNLAGYRAGFVAGDQALGRRFTLAAGDLAYPPDGITIETPSQTFGSGQGA